MKCQHCKEEEAVNTFVEKLLFVLHLCKDCYEIRSEEEHERIYEEVFGGNY